MKIKRRTSLIRCVYDVYPQRQFRGGLGGPLRAGEPLKLTARLPQRFAHLLILHIRETRDLRVRLLDEHGGLDPVRLIARRLYDVVSDSSGVLKDDKSI